jgi:hypothetical protein
MGIVSSQPGRECQIKARFRWIAENFINSSKTLAYFLAATGASVGFGIAGLGGHG